MTSWSADGLPQMAQIAQKCVVIDIIHFFSKSWFQIEKPYETEMEPIVALNRQFGSINKGLLPRVKLLYPKN